MRSVSLEIFPDDIVELNMNVYLTDIKLSGLAVELEEIKFIEKRSGNKFKLVKIEDDGGVGEMVSTVSDAVKKDKE